MSDFSLKKNEPKPQKIIRLEPKYKRTMEEVCEKQKKLRLFKDVYKAYSKAAKIALSNNMGDEAKRCLDRMEELRRRQDGYWVDGWIDNAADYRLLPGFIGQQSRITWLQTEDRELDYAKNTLKRVQDKARALEKSKAQPQIREEHFPIDVKISRGSISFKHPDLERWTRGKSLGADFEMEALARVIEQNRLQELDQDYDRAQGEAPKKVLRRYDDRER